MAKNLLIRLDAQHRLYIALAVTLIVFIFSYGKFSIPALIMLDWGSCATTIIILNWVVILTAHPREMRQIARLKDSSRFIILSFVIIASCVSLFSIIFLLKSVSKDPGHTHAAHHILMSIGSVIVSWWMLHTVFTMSYAHLFYTLTPEDDDAKDAVIGGLKFPDEDMNPDYVDFVYFSFVIGMTFQVSDVEITSRAIRRIALYHALISFAFNTAIVALSINVVSGLIGS
jgi:uncharacterized membrane protein